MTVFAHKINPGELIVKDADILIGLMERRFASLLTIIIYEVAKKFGIVITESYRDKQHPNDLHGTQPVRAIDLRSWCYGTDQAAYKIERWINKRWAYDYNRPERKVAIIHRVGSGAMHFHIQVHPHTRRVSI